MQNEPPYDKTCKLACALSEDSDQPGHPPSLIRAFAFRMKKPLGPRLIWVFAGRTCHFIGFVMRWLKYEYYNKHGFDFYTSHVMRKPVIAICEQQRRRSACASAQSDQRLCYSLLRKFNICSFYRQNLKSRISLYCWADQFESYMVANLEDKISRDVVHMLNMALLKIDLKSSKGNEITKYDLYVSAS